MTWSLQQHLLVAGEVNLEKVIDQTKAVLRFGGGCQGCGMVDLTLKDGVEKTLKDNIPELTAVSYTHLTLPTKRIV